MQQRYYDPQIGRLLSVDPVAVRETGDNFNRYAYANNNPYRFTDPDGRDSASLYNRPELQMAQPPPEALAGVVVGVAAIYGGARGGTVLRWMLTTPKGRAVALAIMHKVSKNVDDPANVATRVQEAAVKEMKETKKAIGKEVKELKETRPPDPPKPHDPPKPRKPPDPPKPPDPLK